MVCDNKEDEGNYTLKVMFSTERGIEPFLARSISGAGKVYPAPFSFKGRVLVEDISELSLLRLIYRNPLYHKAYIVMGNISISKERECLYDIYQRVLESHIFDILDFRLPFAVKTTRKGNHHFTSEDVSAYIGAAIIDGCRKRFGFRAPVDLKNPSIILSADVINDRFIWGVELIGYESMHKRRWHVFYHRAGIKTTLANAMLILGGYSPFSVLLDPMCGSGTIPIEAAHRCINLPAAYFRKEEFIFLKAGLFKDLWFDVVEEENRLIQWSKNCFIFASDRSSKSVQGALSNAKRALVSDKISFLNCDVKDLENSLLSKIDIIVTNPPYGIRMGGLNKAKESLISLFNAFEESCAKTLVIIHPNVPLVFEVLAKYSFVVDKKIEAYNGNLRVALLRLIKPF